MLSYKDTLQGMEENIGMFGWLGRTAMAGGQLEEAIMNFTEGLNRVPRDFPHLAAAFLMDRSECFWLLHQYQESFNDMRQAMEIGLPAVDANDAKVRLIYFIYKSIEDCVCNAL